MSGKVSEKKQKRDTPSGTEGADRIAPHAERMTATDGNAPAPRAEAIQHGVDGQPVQTATAGTGLLPEDFPQEEQIRPLPLEFESDLLRQQYEQLHPRLRDLLEVISIFLAEKGWKALFLTDAIRSVPSQIEIYAGLWFHAVQSLFDGSRKFGELKNDEQTGLKWLLLHGHLSYEFKALIHAAVNGTFTLTGEDLKRLQARLLADLMPQLRDSALLKFTWHWVRCAVDIRTSGGGKPRYDAAQAKELADFVREHTKGQKTDDGRDLYEVILHDVKGPHLHIGIRDAEWRAEFMPNTRGDRHA